MRSHKSVLMAIRGVYFILLAAMTIRAWVSGGVPLALPVILVVYLATIAVMIREGKKEFFRERVQGALILFDLFVLVVALVSLQEFRQDLILAIFLIVVLASASRKLPLALAGFCAVASLFLWLTSVEQDWTQVVAAQGSKLVALFVVAIYVGYLSESLARETERRVEAESRMSRELAGLQRGRELAAGLNAAMDPTQLMLMLAENAASILGSQILGLFWRKQGDHAFRLESTGGITIPETLLEEALAKEATLRSEIKEGSEDRSFLITPMSAAVAGLEGVFVAGWSGAREDRKIEEEALEVVASLGTILLENAALRGCLSQARDTWQGAFQSVPTPVVIVDDEEKIVQANDAFARRSGADALELIGKKLPEFLEHQMDPDGRMEELKIPRLGGSFDAVRGPYVTSAGPGSIWVFLPAA